MSRENKEERNRKKQIKKKNNLGYYGIFNLYRNFYKNSSFILAIILSFVLTAATAVTNSTYEILIYVQGKAETIMPGILGFSLAAFSIIVTFGDRAVLTKLLKKKGDGNSYYEKIIAIFAFIVLLHAGTLLFTLAVDLITKLDQLLNIKLASEYVTTVNLSGLFIIAAMMLFSLLSIMDLVSSVFSFGMGYAKIIQHDDGNEN